MRYGFCGIVLAFTLGCLAGDTPAPASAPAAAPGSPTVKLKTTALDIGGGVNLDLIEIPAGEFEMGSPPAEKEREENEALHTVKISKPFWMGKCEITNDQFRRFRPEHKSGTLDGGTQPVLFVSWYDAVAFCQWLSKQSGKAVRLPTEAEWEYSCRAGTKTRFHSGDQSSLQSSGPLHRVAWYGGNCRGQSNPVGQKEPNAWGLHDMHGNAWEWCQDWYDAGYYKNSPAADPQGPESGQGRVLRGGGYYYWITYYCRSAHRFRCRPEWRESTFGFRVVVEEGGDAAAAAAKFKIPAEIPVRPAPLYAESAVTPKEKELAAKFGYPVVETPKPAQTPAMDGDLGDAAWKEARPLELRFGNGRAIMPSQPTFVRVLADAQNLYVAFECIESEMKNLSVRGKQRDDAVWQGDCVEIFLDPRNELQPKSYYQISINPDGVTLDTKGRDAAWNPKLVVAHKRLENAWTLEAAIPLADLDVKDGEIPSVWAVNFTRFRPAIADGKPKRGTLVPHAWPVDNVELLRFAEDSSWAVTLADTSHVPSRFGHAALAVGQKETPPTEKLFELIEYEDFSSGTIGKFSAGKLVDDGYMGQGKALHITDKEVASWKIPMKPVRDISLLVAIKTAPGQSVYWHTYGELTKSEKLCPGQADTLTRDTVVLPPSFNYCSGSGRLDATAHGVADDYRAGFKKHLLWTSEATIGRLSYVGPKYYAICHTRIGHMITQHPDNKAIDPDNENVRGFFFHNADGKDVFISRAVLFRGVDNAPPQKVTGVGCKIAGENATLSWKEAKDNTLTIWYQVWTGKDKPETLLAEVPELSVTVPAASVNGKMIYVVAADYFENLSVPSDPTLPIP